MGYFLFLDDERFPHDAVKWCHGILKYYGMDMQICRNMADVQHTIAELGMPSAISFDHDLGENQSTGYDVVKWLVELDMVDTSGAFKFPEDFSFTVHSKNPVGAKNIQMYLDNYLKMRD